MDDEGFESTFIETLITNQDKQTTPLLQLPAPNPITQQPDYSQARTYPHQQKCIYRKHYSTLTKTTLNQRLLQPTVRGELFDSNFECGNLAAVYQVTQFEYDLLLSEDINTKGYSQWFYFRVNNINEQTFQFNIINLTKHYSQYCNGFGVYINVDGLWSILKSQVLVKQSHYQPEGRTNRYTITFWITRAYRTFSIALGIPYTNADLDLYLNNLHSEVIATSLSGLPIKMLQFGSKRSDVILVIARQHPGEAVSSHVCQGFLDALQRDKTLQLFYNVIVIPIVNPDGVKWGNFRCDLSGRDLNRVWQLPSRHQKQILAIRKLIIQILEEGRDIKSFIDLHGHSKKLGTFMYACRNPDDPIECRLLPGIMAEHCKYFDFDSCTYSLQPDKLKTARAFAFSQLQKYKPNNFHNIVTLETSFFGYKRNNKHIQYSIDDLHQIGSDLHNSLKIYYMEQESRIQMKNNLEKQKDYFEELDLRESLEESDSEAEEGLLKIDESKLDFLLQSPEKQKNFSRGKTSESKSRKFKKAVHPFLAGQCDKQSQFHKQTKMESKSLKKINQTITLHQTPQTPSVLNKINRNLSSHNKQGTHMHSYNNLEQQDQMIQSSRVLRPSRTMKDFRLKQEQKIVIQSPNDKHLLFERTLKVKRKNTQTIKLF